LRIWKKTQVPSEVVEMVVGIMGETPGVDPVCWRIARAQQPVGKQCCPCDPQAHSIIGAFRDIENSNGARLVLVALSWVSVESRGNGMVGWRASIIVGRSARHSDLTEFTSLLEDTQRRDTASCQ
jgi:hypothetical protein